MSKWDSTRALNFAEGATVAILYSAEISNLVVFAQWRAVAENETGEKLQRVRSDNAKEYVSQYIKQEAEGVQQEFTVPYNPPHMESSNG